MKRQKAAAKAVLIAVDGLEPGLLLADARAALRGYTGGGISRWDASGIFQELAVADKAAGTPSARTLLLLYAADLAFRLRWQIRPALAEGRTVVAAPYVDTAYAFGRAAGLKPSWLMNLLKFAPRPQQRRFVHTRGARAAAVTDGFAGFSGRHMRGGVAARKKLLAGTAAQLRRYDK